MKSPSIASLVWLFQIFALSFTIGIISLLIGYFLHAPPPSVSPQLASHTMLILMVKNEAAVIERSLSSIKGHGVNFLLLCDTGSNDTTIQLAEKTWKKNYRIHKTSFINFETTRNECNSYARAYARDLRGMGVELDYILLADADFVMVPRHLQRPVYAVNMVQIHAGLAGHPHNSLNMLIGYETFIHCKYRLWTHEYLDCGPNTTNGHYDGFYYVDYADGSSRPEKLTRDIRLLKAWLETVNETDIRPRALYYLARAYEDSGDWHEALKMYEAHQQEQIYTNYQFYSRYRMALVALMAAEATNKSMPMEVVESLFLMAFSEHDGFFRREPLYQLARYFRMRGHMSKCILYATAGMNLPQVDHDRMPLFLETHVYEWTLEEELAYCLKIKGRTVESKAHYVHILESNRGKLDKTTQERIEAEVK